MECAGNFKDSTNSLISFHCMCICIVLSASPEEFLSFTMSSRLTQNNVEEDRGLYWRSYAFLANNHGGTAG